MKRGIVGVYDGEDPPVPIPNTVVKLAGAENTWLATTREDKSMPTLLFFYIKKLRPVGQVVKTAASHAVNIGSNPVRVTTFFLDKRAGSPYN